MGKALSLIGWWLVVLAIFVVGLSLPDIWYELRRMQGLKADGENAELIGIFIILAITIFESVCFLRGLFTGRILFTLRHVVPVLIFAYAFLVDSYPDMAVHTGWSLEQARFALFRERYEECAATAQKSFGGYKFKTCELQIAGNTSFWAIAYDTSDEIGRQLGLRSPEFNDYLIRFESPIYTECGRLVASKLAPHFFSLATSCQ
jgi:hypothetical protein